jgi:ParB-like chromosome segregation protein Spo0J
MPTTTKKTPRKVRYEPVLKLPSLPYEQFLALRDNIAVNGVLVPILVDSDGPVRRIIDGNYRKAIADELGYDCPEISQDGLSEEEKRTLARALNLARRQLTLEQKRHVHHGVTEAHYQAGDLIYREGDRLTQMFLITRGKA